MAPAGPRQAFAIVTDARKRVEIVIAGDDLRLVRSICRKRHKFVDRFMLRRVSFAHTDNQFAVRSNPSIGISQTGRLGWLWRDGIRFGVGIEPVKTLIFKVGKKIVSLCRKYAPPPYSWTRVLALYAGDKTSTGDPEGEQRMMATRPASSGRLSSQ